MEMQVQELIEQIKKEGVEAAEAEAEAILKAAKDKAEKMISDAQAQADKLMLDAKNANEKMVKASEDAIAQAGRNLLISFRESVNRELKAIAGEHVNAAYSSQSLVQLILAVVERWADKPEAEDMSVILNSRDLEELEGMLLAALKAKMTGGITLKANDNFDGGFRIAVNNGSVYYDYSSEAVVDMISNYLSPKVTELLKEAK